MKICISSPFKTECDWIYNLTVKNTLEKQYPDAKIIVTSSNDYEYGNECDKFKDHVNSLKNCDLLVTVLNSFNTDPIPAWETGFCYARGIPIIVLYTDVSGRNPYEMLSLNAVLQSADMKITNVKDLKNLDLTYWCHFRILRDIIKDTEFYDECDVRSPLNDYDREIMNFLYEFAKKRGTSIKDILTWFESSLSPRQHMIIHTSRVLNNGASMWCLLKDIMIHYFITSSHGGYLFRHEWIYTKEELLPYADNMGVSLEED